MVDLDCRNPGHRTVRRRTLAALAVSTLAAPRVVSAQARDPGPAVKAAIDRFAELPGASCLVIADTKEPWTAAYKASERRFVGSALKTFILARYLRDVEDGRLTLDRQLAVDDGHRTLNSPVFLNLTGTTAATSVLEAMITHSDNSATDIAMAAVGVDRVRALIRRSQAQTGPKVTHGPLMLDTVRTVAVQVTATATLGAAFGWGAWALALICM